MVQWYLQNRKKSDKNANSEQRTANKTNKNTIATVHKRDMRTSMMSIEKKRKLNMDSSMRYVYIRRWLCFTTHMLLLNRTRSNHNRPVAARHPSPVQRDGQVRVDIFLESETNLASTDEDGESVAVQARKW